MIKALQKIPPPSLETILQDILKQLDTQQWTIEALFQALKGRGYPFLLVLFALPFCQPIQIPGFSTPFGIVIIFIGLRMIFGRRVWWPKWILKQKISTKFLRQVLKKSLWLIQKLKRFVYPRWTWICNDPFLHYIHGFFVILMGFYLALPLPIPFSNILAAWALFLMGLGLIEDDGIFICIGYIVGLSGLVMLGAIFVWIGDWIRA